MKKVNSIAHQEYSSVVKALNSAVGTKQEGRHFGEVIKATGFSPSWLSRFLDGGIRDAGYSRIRTLQQFLTAKGFLPCEITAHASNRAGVDLALCSNESQKSEIETLNR